MSQLGKFDAGITKGRRLWIAALMEMIPEKTQYPDANFTMRLTYGSVQDYVRKTLLNIIITQPFRCG